MKKLCIFCIFFISIFIPMNIFAASYHLDIEGSLDHRDDDNELRAYFVSPTGSKTDVSSDSDLTWKSSDEKIATIRNDGEIDFSGESGEVEFTATYETGTGITYTDTFTYEIGDVDSKSYRFKIRGELDVKKDTNTLTAYKLYPNDDEEDVDNEYVTWKSSDKGVATVNKDGVVTFTKKAGRITITATYRGHVANISDKYPTNVEELMINESLHFNSSFFTNPPRLTVTAKLNDDTREAIPYPEWSSSDESIATIDEYGKIDLTGKDGVVTFTARDNDKEASINLTIPKDKLVVLNQLIIKENLLYSTGEQPLHAIAVYSNNSAKDVTDETTFTSSNNEIAQIFGNKVYFTGLPGKLSVTASYKDKFATVDTIVHKPGLSKELFNIQFEKNALTYDDNNSKIKIYGIYNDNTSKVLGNIKFHTYKPNVVAISSGYLKFKGNPGTAKIEASYGRFRDTINAYNFQPEGIYKPVKLFIKANLNSRSKYIPFRAYALFSNGSLEDVTELASWNTSNTSYATLNLSTKQIEIEENGDFTISASYDGLYAKVASRKHLFPNFIHAINTDFVNPERINSEAKRMLELNKYLPYPKDISGHWAEKILRNSQIIGWIKGYSDGTLKPDKKITRGEFAALLDRAFMLNASTSETYSDTASHWSRPSVSKLKALNLYPMYVDRFRPDDYLTREEMADFISKLASVRETDNNPYLDVDDSNPYKTAIMKVTQGGVMVGIDANRFYPKTQATRAQALTVIFNLLKTEPNLDATLSK